MSNGAVSERLTDISNSPKQQLVETVFLSLGCFSASPTLDFGQCLLLKEKHGAICIANSRDTDALVEVEKLPLDKGFRVEMMKFQVPANSSEAVKVIWAPSNIGAVRGIIRFLVDQRFRYQVVLLGNCEEKKGRRVKTGKENVKKSQCATRRSIAMPEPTRVSVPDPVSEVQVAAPLRLAQVFQSTPLGCSVDDTFILTPKSSQGRVSELPVIITPEKPRLEKIDEISETVSPEDSLEDSLEVDCSLVHKVEEPPQWFDGTPKIEFVEEPSALDLDQFNSGGRATKSQSPEIRFYTHKSATKSGGRRRRRTWSKPTSLLKFSLFAQLAEEPESAQIHFEATPPCRRYTIDSTTEVKMVCATKEEVRLTPPVQNTRPVSSMTTERPLPRRVPRLEPIRTVSAVNERKKPQLAAPSSSKRCKAVVAAMKKPRLPMRKLILLPPKGDTSMPIHPNPFIAKNMYFDERWWEKQQRAFTSWLNYVLTPIDDEGGAATEKKATVYVGHLMQQTTPCPVAPSKEEMSLRAYSATRRLNRLRRRVLILYMDKRFVPFVRKLEEAVVLGRIAVRDDVQFTRDLGIKQSILEMLLSFNPLWLRIGLETIFSEIVPMQSASDVETLSRFIVLRMLSDPSLFSTASICVSSNPNQPGKGIHRLLSEHILKKFLLLMTFLDFAKSTRIIDHNPCLFCVDSEFKQTRDVLIGFSQKYLAGEGDLCKHLTYLGYSVQHKQSALDEYPYGVAKIAVDLRDGLRLTRVVETLLGRVGELANEMRCPAISLLQKVHNTKVAFRELEKAGISVSDIDAKVIVEGHREKTLELLWRISFGLQIETLLDKDHLRREIVFLRSHYRLKKGLAAFLSCPMSHQPLQSNESNDRESIAACSSSEAVQLLLRWCKAVCAYYELKIRDFTVSFSDGRALCLLVHHYQPKLIELDSIQTETSQSRRLHGSQQQEATHLAYLNYSNSESAEDSFESICYFSQSSPAAARDQRFGNLIQNEKENFKLLNQKLRELGGVPLMLQAQDMVNTIPDERAVICFLTYLAARLLNLDEELRAARRIQKWWRSRQYRAQSALFEVRREAGFRILRSLRRLVARRRLARLSRSVQMVQQFARGYIARKSYAERNRRHEAALRIQKTWRTWRCQSAYNRLRQTAISVQARFRGSKIRRSFVELRAAAVVVQRAFRAVRARRREAAAVRIQRAVGAWLFCRRLNRARQERQRAASVLQRFWRSRQATRQQRQVFVRIRTAAIVLQTVFRQNHQRRAYLSLRRATITLQSHVRGWLWRARLAKLRHSVAVVEARFVALTEGRAARTRYVQLRQAAIVIQARWRMVAARRTHLRMRAAAVVLQTAFRRATARRHFVRVRHAAVVLQKTWRCVAARKQFVRTRAAAITLQANWRSAHMRKTFVRMRAAAILVQKYLRCFAARRRYLRMRNAAIVIQARARRHLARRHYVQLRQATILLQTHWRRHVARSRYVRMRAAAIFTQKCVRRFVARRRYLRMRRAAVTIQKRMRGAILRRRFVRMRSAAITLQQHARRHLVQRAYQRLRKAAILVQTQQRCHVARSRFVRTRAATILTQKCVRRFVARRRYLRMRSAAVMIQKRIRGAILRRRFVRMRTAAITLQQHVRRHVAQRAYQRLRKAAILVQAQWRHRAARSRYVRMRAAAIVTQKWVRRFVARRRYLRTRNAAVIIEKYVRRDLDRRRYVKLRAAAILVQKCVRRSIERRRFVRLRTAAIRIQTWFRAVAARKRFVRMRTAAVVLQTARRRHVARRRYLQARHAALTLQGAFRTWHQRRHFLALRSATILAQAHWKARSQRKRYLQLRASAVVIQQRFRARRLGAQQRQQWLTMRAATIRIQAWWKARLQTRQFTRLKATATTVQRWFRRRMAEKKRHDSAATVIQAFWRGYQVRRSAPAPLADVCTRLRELHESEQQLIQKTYSAVTYLTSSNVLDDLYNAHYCSKVYRILEELERTSRASKACCATLVPLVPSLYQLLDSLNRSEPSKCFVLMSLSILLNITKYADILQQVALYTDGVCAVTQVMIKFPKEEKLVVGALDLLHRLLSTNPSLGQVINSNKEVKFKLATFCRSYSKRGRPSPVFKLLSKYI